MPKNFGVDTFPDPVGHFEAPWRLFLILQAVWRCRQWESAPGAAMLVFSKYFYLVIYRTFPFINLENLSQDSYFGYPALTYIRPTLLHLFSADCQPSAGCVKTTNQKLQWKGGKIHDWLLHYNLYMTALLEHIWVIGSRRLMPIENCRGFPKMVSVLALRVTSIFIGFTNRFFLLFTDSPCAAPM